MNTAELRALQAAILASAACAPHVITNGMPKVPSAEAAAADRAIAEIISAGRTRIAPTRIGELGVLARYPSGPIDADAVLSKLEAYSVAGSPLSSLVARALRGIRSPDGLDFGDTATQTMLAALGQSGGPLTAAEAQALASMASVPDPVTAADVSRALRGPWGDE